MSFDDKQHMDNNELDLAELFRTVWSYKFSLLIFIIISVPVSVMFSTTLEPTYKAETVFEKPSNNSSQSNTSLLNNIEGVGVLGFLRGGPTGGVADIFYSEIRSESFLKTVILNNAELDNQKLKENCPLPPVSTPQWSLRSLLILLGVSEDKTPSENQKISLTVKCVNEMLAINSDRYGSSESSAYRLSIESNDPDFSANLANQIVEKYFVRLEKVRDQDFKDVKAYLSKVITEAQLEFTEVNNLMQSFILKNTLLMNLKPSVFTPNEEIEATGLPLPPSPFAAKLNKEVFNLGQLKNSMSKLKKASLALSNLTKLGRDEIEKAISSTGIQEVLSRTFVTSLAKIDKLSAETTFKNQEIKKILSEELRTLYQQSKAIRETIEKKEAQTIQLMNIENRFQELAIDLSRKKLIFEGLKDQLKDKILTAGLANIEQPVLLTKAVPPFSKASPNRKLIMALGVVLTFFIVVVCILIRQSFLRRIHSLSQLRNLSGFLNCYKIKYKELQLNGERSGESLITQSFFSHSKDIGKLGCIIDISQKKLNNSLALEFFSTIVSPLAGNSSKIVCLNSPASKKPFSKYSQKNFVSENSNFDAQGVPDRRISIFNDEDGLIGSGEITKIKNKYSGYDKIICTLSAETDLTKFKFIEQSDFYILIGRSFHFDEHTFKKFSNNLWEKQKKCLGFFLID